MICNAIWNAVMVNGTRLEHFNFVRFRWMQQMNVGTRWSRFHSIPRWDFASHCSKSDAHNQRIKDTQSISINHSISCTKSNECGPHTNIRLNMNNNVFLYFLPCYSLRVSLSFSPMCFNICLMKSAAWGELAVLMALSTHLLTVMHMLYTI